MFPIDLENLPKRFDQVPFLSGNVRQVKCGESAKQSVYALHMLKFKENKNEELPTPIEVVTNPYL